MRRATIALAVASVALACAPAAGSAPGMLVGVAEDALKWDSAHTVAVARHLGLQAFRITLLWKPGQTKLSAGDASSLSRAVVGAGGMRVVVAVYTREAPSPGDEAGRQAYCSYLTDVLRRFPQVNDVVVWNEPNLTAFWRPQFGAHGVSEAPARYGALLAHCYDVLHAVRPSVNVVAPATSLWGNDNPNAFSNVSHSPARFIRELGAAYRASGRTLPLFDTLGHHPYPPNSSERPWAVHANEAYVSLGDIERLLEVLRDAFGGTAQPLPEQGLQLWYLESGYQTLVDAHKRALYGGVENWPGPVPDLAPQPSPPARPPDDSPAPDQATQLTDSLRMTYCQPFVGAVFNFLLRDEPDLAGWQSGILWADGSPKDSYDAYRTVVAEVNERRVDCGLVAGAPGVGPPAAAPPPPTQGAARRLLTKLSYRSRPRAPYGFLRPRARLTRGVTESDRSLAGREVVFMVGNVAYLTRTNALGTATIAPSPPLPPGTHRIAVRFGGDELHLGSGLQVPVRVINSRGRVATRGSLPLRRGVDVRLSARSRRGAARGTLVVRERGRARTVRLTTLGLRPDGRAAWLGGLDRRRARHVVNVERLPRKRVVRIRVWRNDALVARGTAPASAVRIARR